MKGSRIIPLLVALAALSCQAQDYDYESVPVPRRPAPSRIQPGYSGPVQPKPTPVAILKQINRHNEDGSYTYGYEGGDGSFKIETKLPTGEVKGKYGYVDDAGKLKVVEYGANKYGFQPAGEGITVPPPTLVDESVRKDGLQAQEFDDGQYYQPAPQIRAQPVQAAPRPRPRPVARPPPPPQYEDYSDSPSPIPQRPLQIPGAIPSGVVYSEQPRSITRPSHQQTFQSVPQRSFAASPPPQRFTQPKFVNAPAPTPLRSFASYIEPAPVKQNLDDITYARPIPQQQTPQYAPAPQPRPQPQPIQYSAPRQAQRQSGGGILDQLAKDYALPSGGAPALHDISFGYY